MQMRWLVLMVVGVVALGCGGDDEPPAMASVDDVDAGMRTTRECMDEDHDGFGEYCEPGEDCDDDDPEVTDECYRCRYPAVDCPCDPGTEGVFCMPPQIQVEGGVLVCSEGTRYCRDGLWSECEIIGEYTFVPTGQ